MPFVFCFLFTRNRLIPPPQTTKKTKKKIQETMALKTLDIRQQGIYSLEREKKWVKSNECWADCLHRAYRAMVPGERIQVTPVISVSWGDGTENLTISRLLEFTGQSIKEERAVRKENSEDLSTVHFSIIIFLYFFFIYLSWFWVCVIVYFS